jgi:hypothetical protein
MDADPQINTLDDIAFEADKVRGPDRSRIRSPPFTLALARPLLLPPFHYPYPSALVLTTAAGGQRDGAGRPSAAPEADYRERRGGER